MANKPIMSIQEETAQIIKLKQDILRQYPNSGKHMLDAKTRKGYDIIFYMMPTNPGYDAFLRNDGTVILRFGFGTKARLRQYGGFARADERLRNDGYEPFNIFIPGVYEKYEQRHQDEKERISKSQDFFPDFQKFNPKAQMRSEPEQANLADMGRAIYPQQQRPIRQPVRVQGRTGPSIKQTMASNANIDYARLHDEINHLHDLAKPKFKPTDIMDSGEFAMWSRGLQAKLLGVPRKKK
jgi:hypothetical protein